MASRSAVLTPGATASRIRRRASATTSPAARIFSIWSGVFSWMSSWGRRMERLPFVAIQRGTSRVPRCSHSIRRGGGRTSAAVRPQGVDGPGGDVLHRTGGVDPDQLALGAVVVDQGRGLLAVLPQAGGDGLRLVVVALEQLGAAPVTDARPGGGVELDVPDLAATPAGAPAGEPPDHLVVVDHQLQDQIQGGAQIGEELVQSGGLRSRPREAVEQKALARVRLGEPVPDHVDGDLVRNQLACVHVTLRLDAERRALGDVRAEDVS